jgi:hypothetical protein
VKKNLIASNRRAGGAQVGQTPQKFCARGVRGARTRRKSVRENHCAMRVFVSRQETPSRGEVFAR